MQDITDDIIALASEGDLQAFEAVYKASASFVYNVAFRVVGHREDAEEVTQEVFLIIHDKLKSFRFESSFKTWAYRITTNCAINYAKKIAKIRNKTVVYEDTMVAGEGDARKDMDQEYQAAVIAGLLDSLNPEQRTCIVLRNIEGLSYQDIAASLNININTVRSRLKRAREHLLAKRKQVSYGRV